MLQSKTATLLFAAVLTVVMTYGLAGSFGGEVVAEAEGRSHAELHLPTGVEGPFAVTISAEFRRRTDVRRAHPVHARLLGADGVVRDLQLLSGADAMQMGVHQWDRTKRFASVSEPLVPGQTVRVSLEPSEFYRTQSLRVSVRGETVADGQ